jgi:phospholipid transport system substrate-binding protein
MEPFTNCPTVKRYDGFGRRVTNAAGKNSLKLNLTAWLLILLGIFSTTTYAQDSMTTDAQALRQTIITRSSQLVALLNQNRQKYSADSELFQQDLEKQLGGVVDFERISRKIMGRYAHVVAPEKRAEFLKVFKQSLYRNYGSTLLESHNISMQVESVLINPRNPAYGRVNLTISSASSQPTPVVYSMFRNDEGVWKIENIVVLGVNVGLAYRDRFAQEMQHYNGNIDAVIRNWAGGGKQSAPKSLAVADLD